MSDAPVVVWLRDDLRIADNPALRAAVDTERPVVVTYLLDEESREVRPHGGASRWWLHGSLAALGAELEARGASLVLRRGPAETALRQLLDDTGADTVFWNRRYSRSRAIDARLKEQLPKDDVKAHSFAASLLAEPWDVQTGDGGGFKVFSPFWRALRQLDLRHPVAEPRKIRGFGPKGRGADGDGLDDWGLLPTKPDWAGGLRDTWTPGEHGAHERLNDFVHGALDHYDRRDEPAADATSMLSPHLRWGEVSPIQIWNRLHGDLPAEARSHVDQYLRQVAWRDFNWGILYANPDLPTENYRDGWNAFPWHPGRKDELERWQQGRTGIPLVDAGMRELWHTGYMQNRVRLVTASLLVKNLLIDWRTGERWFWDTLVDADEANNPGNWQWVAGTGADAAPYFRVFNPETQATKFDPHERYIRHWVPEVGSDDYPEPIVDLKESRQAALDAYASIRR